eukprot:2733069-Rhodomonas_salina.2
MTQDSAYEIAQGVSGEHSDRCVEQRVVSGGSAGKRREVRRERRRGEENEGAGEEKRKMRKKERKRRRARRSGQEKRKQEPTEDEEEGAEQRKREGRGDLVTVCGAPKREESCHTRDATTACASAALPQKRKRKK